MVYCIYRYLIIIFKALNLFWNKYVVGIQLPGNDLWLLSYHRGSIQSSYMALYWSHVKNKCICSWHAVACSWAFVLKPWLWQALLSFYQSAKHAPFTFPKANLGKMAIRAVFYSLGIFVLYYRSPCTLCFTSEKREKGGFSGLESKRRWLKPFLF